MGVGLADMELIIKFNKGFRFLLCVIDLFSKYAWVVLVKGRKGVTITNAFKVKLNNSIRKSIKIWVGQGSEFYSSSFKKWLKDNDIEIYSTQNEGNSVVAERFMGTLKDKSYKHMTSISKNVYIDKLEDIIHIIDAKSGNDIECKVNSNDKNPKFKFGDHVRISKYKNIFAKVYTPNWLEEIFVIKKIKNTVPWT